ncbi:MAG: hypothetical protein R6U46_14345 [Marinilabilia sp.]
MGELSWQRAKSSWQTRKLQLAEEFGCHEVVIWWDKVGSGQWAVGKSDKLQPEEK